MKKPHSYPPDGSLDVQVPPDPPGTSRVQMLLESWNAALPKTPQFYTIARGWDMHSFLLTHVPLTKQKATHLLGADGVTPCPSLWQRERLMCLLGAVAIPTVILMQHVL